MALSRGREGLSTHFEQCVNMTVTYNGIHSIRVQNGIQMRRDSIISRPTVVVEGGEAGTLFTLVMTDRDHTSTHDQHRREYVIWIVSDIRAGTTGEETRSEVLSYEIPRPETGFHKYMFWHFKQMGRPISSMELSRDHFLMCRFSADHNLGAPVASLCFYIKVPRMAEVIRYVMESLEQRVRMDVSYNGLFLFRNGILFPVHEVRSQPNVEIFTRDDYRTVDLFTLVMIDRVELSPIPDRTEFLHWLVTDIPAGHTAHQGIMRMPYTSPNPMRGINRYMFVLFKQTEWQQVRTPPELPHEFSTRMFALDNNLGTPVAHVWFMVP